MMVTNFEEKAIHLKEFAKAKILSVLSLLPDPLRNTIGPKCVVSGSCFSSMFHGEEPRDYDFWFRDSKDIAPTKQYVIDSYEEYIESWSQDYRGDESVKKESADKVITANAITLENKMQLITIADYKTCRERFDYKHCLPYYDLQADKFYISMEQMACIENKKLVANNGNVANEKRYLKFYDRGWSK